MTKLTLSIFILILSYTQLSAQVEAIKKLLIERYPVRNTGVSILVANETGIIVRDSFGKSNLELNVDAKPSNIYKIASITKPFTALATLLLNEKGLLSTEDPIRKYFDSVPDSWSKVKIKHLLSHTSGIVDYDDTDIFDELYIKHYFDLVNGELNPDSLLKSLFETDLDFEAGQKFSYCNSGYFLLERIIENVSGKTFTNYLTENIFNPLEMNSTRFYSNTDVIPNKVDGYTDSDGTVLRNPFEELSGIMPKGPGSILSCIDDLYNFAHELSSSENSLNFDPNYFYEPFILSDNSKSVYSLGMFSRMLKGNKFLNHNGDSPGFASSMSIMPDDNIVIIILGNSDLYSYGSSRYHEITARRIAAVLIDNPFPDFKRIELSEDVLKTFVGSYVSASGTERDILYEDGKLFSQRGRGRKIEIIPFDSNKFYYDQHLIFVEFVNDEKTGNMIMNFNYDDGAIAPSLRK